MKRLKAIMALGLAAALTLAACGGGGGNAGGNDSGGSTAGENTSNETENQDGGEVVRENVNIRFAQFGNSLDDVDGFANDPIRKAIEERLNITLEYDTGVDGFDDRMQTELYTGGAPDLFPTWGQPEVISKYVEEELVTDIGAIVNADPGRYPTLYKIINSTEYKGYNKLYSGDENKTYAIYSIAAFADPIFNGVPVYNQAILDEVNGGKVPATVDEFLSYCEKAGAAGYVGWWPRNDKLTNWGEISSTLALPQGTDILSPSGAGNGTIMTGTLGKDETWHISATSDASKAVVAQLATLVKNGGFDKNIGVKGDFDEAYSDFAAGKIGAANFGFGYPGQFRDFYYKPWQESNPDATMDDLTVGVALKGNNGYGKIYQSRTWMNSHYFIPTSCSYPDRVLDLVEFLASNEGQDLTHNAVNGQFNSAQGPDYWRAINSAYGYSDDRCYYVWFSYMFFGVEFYYCDFENQDWWTAVSNPVDFSSNWDTEESAALFSKAQTAIGTFVKDVIVPLPSYYDMVALPEEASSIIASLKEVTNEYLTQFIGGQRDIEADWSKYVEAYEKAGAANLEKMINEAVATARSTYGD